MANTITRSFTGYTFNYAAFDENRSPIIKEVFVPIRDHDKALRKARSFGALLDENGVFVDETREMKVEDFYALSTLVDSSSKTESEPEEPSEESQDAPAQDDANVPDEEAAPPDEAQEDTPPVDEPFKEDFE